MDERYAADEGNVSRRWRGGHVRAVVLAGLVLASSVALGFSAVAAQDGATTNAARDGAAGQSQVSTQATELSSCTVVDEPGRYVLTSDVGDGDDGACIDVRASDVIIDGNGHVVDGAGGTDSIGVSVAGTQETAANLENVTVRDLRVTDWSTGVQAGVAMVRGPAVRLENVTVTGSDAGVSLGEADGSVLAGVTVRGNGDGLSVTESTVEMHAVVATGNDGNGVFLGQGSAGSSLTDARVTGNGGDGLVFDGPTVDIPVRNATVSDNGGTGIAFRGDAGNVTVQNSVVSNNTQSGIDVGREASGNVVRDSVVANNEDDGVRVRRGDNRLRNVTLFGNAPDAVNVTANRDDEPVVAEDIHYRGTTMWFETTGIRVSQPSHFPNVPDGTELAGNPVSVEGVPDDGLFRLSMAYGQFDNVESASDVGVWYHPPGDGEWSDLRGVEVDGDSNRASLGAKRNGVYVPLTSADGGDGGQSDHGPTASVFEVRSTSEDSQFAYRFEVDGAVEKTKLGPGKIAADVSDIVAPNDDGTVTVDGSTGDARGDAYLVWGEITGFEVVSGSEDYRLFLDGDDVTNERPPGSGDEQTGDGRTFAIRSTNENSEFSYRFVVDGSVDKAKLGDGGIAADVSDVISREGGNVVVDGSTGEGEGDAYAITGEIQSFEVTTGPPDLALFLDGEEITDEHVPDRQTRTLQIRSTDDDTEFSYRIVVDGQLRKAQLGDGGIAADASDVVSREGGTVTVDGSTGEGEGDAYRFTGTIDTIEITTGPPDARILLGGEDVTDRYLNGDQPPERTFAVRATDEQGSVAYRFDVDGRVRKAQRGDDGIAADASDVVSANDDGTATVDGSTGDGAGDLYVVRGEITDFERLSGGAGLALRFDGGDVTDRFLGDAGEPSIEYVNCSAVRVSGEFHELQMDIVLNINDGIDTANALFSQQEVRQRSDENGVIRVPPQPSAINGSMIGSAELRDAEENRIVHRQIPEGCAGSVSPRFDLGVADVQPRDDGSLDVTFEYTNEHESPLEFDELALRGNVDRAASDPVPDELAPGENTFTVRWVPRSGDERLTWTIDDNSYVMSQRHYEVSTNPASAYDVDLRQSQLANATTTPTATDTPTSTATDTPTPTPTPEPTEEPTEPPEDDEPATDPPAGDEPATEPPEEDEPATEAEPTEPPEEEPEAESTETPSTDEESAEEEEATEAAATEPPADEEEATEAEAAGEATTEEAEEEG